METIPTEFSKILRRVRTLASCPKTYEQVFNPNYICDIKNFNALASNPEWAGVAKLIYSDIREVIEEIKTKKESIFVLGTEYIKMTFIGNHALDFLDDFKPEIDVDIVIIDEKIRREWFAVIELEILEYQRFILVEDGEKKITPTGSFKLKKSVKDEQLERLYWLTISVRSGNEHFIDKTSGGKNEFIATLKANDLSKLQMDDVQFRFGCDNGYACFVLHWLNEKKIISGKWAAVERSGLFFTKTGSANKPVNAPTLRTGLSELIERDTINKIIEKKPEDLSAEDLEENSNTEAILKYLHSELSDIFKPAYK